MEFLKCRDVRWKRREKRNKPNVVATTAKHPDSRSKISRYGWMQPTYMRSVSFWGKFTSGSRISASRSDLLKLPIYGKDYHETDYQCPTWDSSRVLYLTSFLDGFPRKEDEKCSFRG